MAALVLCVTSCSTGDGPPPPEDVARYAPEGSGGGEAQLLGRLERIDRCVYVVDTSSGSRTIPVFPDDQAISWDGEVLRAGPRALSLGEEFELGGGEGSSEVPGVIGPDSCDSGAPLFIVNF